MVFVLDVWLLKIIIYLNKQQVVKIIFQLSKIIGQ